MSKKLIPICMTMAAFAALVLPTAAAASPVLTSSKGGSAVAVGTKITGTNIGTSRFKSDDGSTTLTECSTTVVTGELTKNNGTQIEGNITTVTSSGTGSGFNGMNECTSGVFGNFIVTTNGGGVDGENVENGTPWCLRSGSEDTGTLRGGKCSEAARNITMIVDSTTVGECKYSRATPIQGTFTTESSGDAIVNVVPANSTVAKTSGGILCPSSGTFEVSYTIEADSPEVKPLYIS